MAFNVEQFKADDKEYGADNLKSQLVHLRKLAQTYKRRATQCDVVVKDRWLLYVKAHGLINSCLCRCSQIEIPILEQQLFNLERHWYNGKHPLETIENWRETKTQHREHLQQIRKNCQSRFQQCGKEVASINMDDIFSDENKKIAAEFADTVQKESKNCTEKMVDFAKTICQTSENLVGIVKGKLPCAYAVIGLGSIARGEATPYSDLEYAFIIEDSDHRQYFESLAIDTYFRMSNLGETPLKYLYISELSWFKDRGPCGFRIDGLMPSAGNIPTGNGLTEETLILSVEELVARYRYNLCAASASGLVGNLADLLATTVPVHTSGGGEELINEFLCEKVRIDESEQNLKQNIKTLIADVKKHSKDFCPENLQVDMRKLEIKAHIFRYPTILANDLKILLKLEGETAWDIYRNLRSEGFIDELTLASLHFVLTSAIWIRTSAYLQMGTQKETVTFHTLYDSEMANDRFYAPKKLYIAMACRLIPMKQMIIDSVRSGEEESTNLEDIKRVLRCLRGEKKDFLLQARLHYTCGDYKGGLSHIQAALKDDRVTEDVWKFKDAVQEDCEHAMLLLAYLLFHDGRFDQAMSFFEELCGREKLQNNDCVKLASFHASIGQCLVMLERYEESKKMFDTAGRDIKHLFGISSRKDIPRVLFALATSQRSEQEKEIVLFGSVNSRFLADSVRYHQGRYRKVRKSFENLTHSYILLRSQMTDLPERSLVVADFKMSFGLYHLQFAEYDQAEKCLKLAYDIYSEVFGVSAALVDMSAIHLHLGTLAMARAQYTEAKRLGELSLEVLMKSGQSTASTIIACHHMLAQLYLQRGEYSLSLEHIQSCLGIISESTTERFIFSKAIVQVTHANVIQQKVAHTNYEAGLLQEAESWVVCAIDSLQPIVDKKSKDSHPQIVRAMRVLSQIHLDLGQVEQAKKVAVQAFEGSCKARDDKSCHPDILTAKILLAKVDLRVGHLWTSRQHLNEALLGFNKLYGSNCVHPNLAEVYHLLSQLEAASGSDDLACKHSSDAVSTLKTVFGDEFSHPVLTRYEESLEVMRSLYMPTS